MGTVTPLHDYEVPNAPFRREFERQQECYGLTLSLVAVRMGGCDLKTVRRYLGLERTRAGVVLEEIPAEFAVGLMRALHMWPMDCGL